MDRNSFFFLISIPLWYCSSNSVISLTSIVGLVMSFVRVRTTTISNLRIISIVTYYSSIAKRPCK